MRKGITEVQISLRSPVTAGTTALFGATMLAMTPITPIVALPSLSPAKAAVELADFSNPIAAVADTAGLAVTYYISSQYVLGPGGGSANWGAGIGTNSGISDAVNALIYNSYVPPPGPGFLPRITAVGGIPNFLDVPFPLSVQLLNNWASYAEIGVQAGVQVVDNLSGLLWAPVGLTLAVTQALLTGNAAQIPAIIQNAVQSAIGDVTASIQAVASGVQSIARSVAVKAQALVANIAADISTSFATFQKQAAALSASVQTNLAAISTAIAGGDTQNIWNTAVASLLSPTGIPGAFINLSLGAGIQLNPADPTTYVPSFRALGQTLVQEIQAALATPVPTAAGATRPAAAASPGAVSRSAPAKKKPATAAVGRRHASR